MILNLIDIGVADNHGKDMSSTYVLNEFLRGGHVAIFDGGVVAAALKEFEGLLYLLSLYLVSYYLVRLSI